MVKKAKGKPEPESERSETHMEVFRRLAAVKNMHGTPGQRRTKGGGK